MIKKLLLSLLSMVLLISLGGCDHTESEDYTLDFFYRMNAPTFGGDSGVLGTQSQSFPKGIPTFQAIFDSYFSTPLDSALSSPFPKELRAMGTSLDDGILTIRLSGEFDELTGYAHAIAVACLAQTVLQINGVDAVGLEHESADGQLRQSPILSASDFVSRDFGAMNSETSVRLYFSDPNGRYLVAEERRNIFTDATQIPLYVVQQLILGPTEPGRLATMPEGTQLVDLAVDDSGVCTVNFSSEFLLNRPGTGLLERMCILSIVNSLTELEQIKAVRLHTDGKPLERYLYMDLSQPLIRDDLVGNVVRASLNEVDATLYVQSGDDVPLSAVPVSIRRAASNTLAELLIQRLLDFSGVNGLSNPIPKGTLLLGVEQRGSTCYVDLSTSFLQCAGEEDDELRAIRSIAATLCTIDGIDSVRIAVEGRPEGLKYCDLSQLLIPSDRWLQS